MNVLDCKEQTSANYINTFDSEKKTYSSKLIVCSICRRVGSVVNFNRNWNDYKVGFGNLAGSYWWGTERLYNVTANRTNLVLRIDMMDWDNKTAYAEYDNFQIGSEAEQFKLTVGGYRGNAGDAINFYWCESIQTNTFIFYISYFAVI